MKHQQNILRLDGLLEFGALLNSGKHIKFHAENAHFFLFIFERFSARPRTSSVVSLSVQSTRKDVVTIKMHVRKCAPCARAYPPNTITLDNHEENAINVENKEKTRYERAFRMKLKPIGHERITNSARLLNRTRISRTFRCELHATKLMTLCSMENSKFSLKNQFEFILCIGPWPIMVAVSRRHGKNGSWKMAFVIDRK